MSLCGEEGGGEEDEEEEEEEEEKEEREGEGDFRNGIKSPDSIRWESWK